MMETAKFQLNSPDSLKIKSARFILGFGLIRKTRDGNSLTYTSDVVGTAVSRTQLGAPTQMSLVS